jgi:hypothetical protein
MLYKGLLKCDQLRYSSYQKKDMDPTNISNVKSNIRQLTVPQNMNKNSISVLVSILPI